MTDNADRIQFEVQGTEESNRRLDSMIATFNKFKEAASNALQAAGQRVDVFGNQPITGLDTVTKQAEQSGVAVGEFSTRIAQLSPIVAGADEEVQGIVRSFESVGTSVEVATQVINQLQGQGKLAIAGIGALGAGIAILSKLSADYNKEVERQIDNLKQESDIRREINQLGDASALNIAERIGSTTSELDVLVDEYETILGRQADVTDSFLERYAEFVEKIPIIGDVLDFSAAGELEARGEELREEIDKLNGRLEALRSEEARQVAAINDTIDALTLESDLRLRYAAQINDLTAADIERRVSLAEAERSINEEQINILDDNISFFSAAFGTVEGNIEALRERIADGLDPAMEDAAQKTLELLERNQSLSAEIEYLSDVILPQVEANEEAAESTERLTSALADYNQQITESEDELRRVTDEIANIQQELQSVTAEFAKQDRRQQIIESFEFAIESAKAAEEAARKSKESAEIRREALTKEVQLVQKFATQQEQALDRFNKAVSDLNRDFMDSELEAHQEYLKNERRLNEDFARERLRRQEDLNDNLLDAALDNDVKRFIQLQREGEKQLRREAEDFGVAEKRRAEDFAAERKQAREQFEQRLDDLREQYEEERELQRKAFEEEQRNLQQHLDERLQKLEASGRQELLKSDLLQRELSRLREQWQRQDEEQRRQQRLQALQTELNDQQQHMQQLRQVIENAWDQITSSISFPGSISAPLSSYSSSFIGPPPPPSLSPSIPTAPPYPIGGPQPYPAITVVNEQVNVGQVATPADLTDLVNNMTSAVQLAASQNTNQPGSL